MTAGLSKLATALTVIFIISLTTLVAQLFYVLWRRRVFHRRTRSLTTFHGAAPAHDTHSQTPSDTPIPSSSTSYKELLYFFCLNNKEISQVQPKSSAPPTLNSTGSALDDEMEVIDVFKLQNMYGPSRVLFTIKEEDTLEVDFESDKSMCSSAEKRTEKHSKRISLEDCLKLKFDDQEIQPEVKMDVGDDHDRINMVGENQMTPFLTPCESPLYFTPTASPTPEADTTGKRENGPCDEQMSSTSPEVEV